MISLEQMATFRQSWLRNESSFGPGIPTESASSFPKDVNIDVGVLNRAMVRRERPG